MLLTPSLHLVSTPFLRRILTSPSRLQPSGRMTVELCSGCIETNRLLRNLAEGAGMEHLNFERCENCRQKIVSLERFRDSPVPTTATCDCLVLHVCLNRKPKRRLH